MIAEQWLWNKNNSEQRIDLASYVIFSKYSEAVNQFIESAISSNYLPASSDDYHQSQDKRRELLEKIYNALCHCKLEYDLNEDSLFNNDQQIIRKPSEILTEKRKGTCLDLAIFFCAICWHYDLLPILILLNGHALAAISLTHRRRDWKNDERAGKNTFWHQGGSFTDAPELRRMVNREEYLAVECTGFCQSSTLENPDFPRKDGLLSFPNAYTLGSEQLNKRQLIFALDIQIGYYFWWTKLCKSRVEISVPKSFTNGRNLIQDIYVPLGLIERKTDAKPRPKDSSINPYSPDFNQPDKQYEIVKEYEHDEFFTTVLAQKSTSKSQGKRLVIIGDPGSGKSTLLQKIADWVINEKQGLPIWISLAEFNDELTKKRDVSDAGWLYRYISKSWLRDASGEPEFTPEIWQQIFKLEILQGNQLWLILDGADEMAVSSPLQKIKEQLTLRWTDSVRIILSCRLNLWSESKDILSDKFDIYRTLDFNYPGQVHQFIQNWFGVNKNLANNLQTQLETPNRERLRSLVKNPLRLALLCRIWQEFAGELPNTKAGFYQLLVDNPEFSFNEWNKGKSSELLQNFRYRKELNQQLGELALTAISNKDYQFRLRSTLIEEKLGFPDDEPDKHGNGGSLFWWSLKLGWLLHIGYQTQDENNPVEKVYAFFHPTFQEYFAASVIESCDLFLPKSHKNRPVQGKSYRIFEPQWKEVILLWLGSSNVNDSLKNDFIKKLTNFSSGCGNFYWYRAYFLAAEGIAEFENCEKAEEIAKKIVNWSLGKFNIFECHLLEKTEEAKTILLKSHREKVIAGLIEVIRNTRDEYTHRLVAESLGEIGIGNSDAIACLIEVIHNAQDESTRRLAAESLGEIDPGNSDAIKYTRRLAAAESLGKIGVGNSEAIAGLIEVIRNARNEYTHRLAAAESLGKIGVGNSEAIAGLIEVIRNAPDEYTHRLAAESLGKIGVGNSEAITGLIEVIRNTQDEYTHRLVAESLGEIGIGNSEAITGLIEVIHNTRDEETRGIAAESLGEIGIGNSDVIACLIEVIHNTRDEETRGLAAASLGKIEPGNSDAITALIKVIRNVLLGDVRYAAFSLTEILTLDKMPFVVTKLKTYSKFYTSSYSVIWYCAQSLSYPEFYQAWHKSLI